MPRPDGSLTLFEADPSKASEYGRMGGIKSGKVKREKKLLKEIAKIVLDLQTGEGRALNIDNAKKLGDLFETDERGSLVPKNMTVAEVMVLRQAQRAINGDQKAFELVMEISGQKPANNVKLDGAVPVIITGEDELIDDDPESSEDQSSRGCW